MISTYRDMFAVSAVALLCLMPVSHSAPLACKDLVRPLDQLDPRHLEGRWALVVGGLNNPTNLEFFKRRNSSSINFSNVQATSNIFYTPSVDTGGTCHYHTYNISLEGSVLTFDPRDRVNLTVTFLHTSCPDCLAMRFDNESKEAVRLYVFSRRRGLERTEMEAIRAQIECLNMLPPAVMDPNKEMCPERSVADSAAAQTED